MKHCIVLGTRPEIIKLSSTIRFLHSTKRDFCFIHTNQHYSSAMDEVFFKELRLPLPTENLHVGSGSHGVQTGKMLIALEEILSKVKPDIVYVQGDTNTVVAGAMTAAKLGIPVAHVEAGLRSYDRTMPEELNRIIADHVSRFLFAPTESAASILKQENVSPEWIFTVGNTIVDAVREGLGLLPSMLPSLKVTSPYFLLTLHRPSNVDSEENLRQIWHGLKQVIKDQSIQIIFPIHPRTKAMVDKFNLPPISGLNIVEPTGFLETLWLEKNADLILTDSGGIQEEAFILGQPTVTIRDNTERPETVEAGINALAGNSTEGIVRAVKKMLGIKIKGNHPYGDGKTGQRMVKIVEQTLSS